MKKNLFFIAAAAIAFAACQNDEILVDNGLVEDSEIAIGFDTYAPNMTRAENSDASIYNSLEAHHANFNVWASKNAAGTYQTVWAADAAGLATTPQTSTYYSAEEAKTYNAALTNARKTTDVKTAAVNYANASEYNAAKGTSLTDEAFAALSESEKVKTPAVYYTQDECDTYNATLAGAKKAGDIKDHAVWTATPVKFWDKAASDYYFYAAAPAKDKASTPANVAWTLTWKDATANSEDYSDAYISLNDFSVAGNNISTQYVAQQGTYTAKTGGTTIATDTYYSLTNGGQVLKSDGNVSINEGDTYYEVTGYSPAVLPLDAPNKTFLGAASDLDLMIASPCHIERKASTYQNSNPAKVNLEYNHILSRLNILVKKGSSVSACKVNLTKVQVFNMANKGSFKENTDLDATNTSNGVWDNADLTVLKAGTTKRWTTAALSSDYKPLSVSFKDIEETPRYVLETLIIPQEVGQQDVNIWEAPTEANSQAYIRVDYSIDGEAFFGYYNLAKAFGATSSNKIAFNEGWQNNLTITINPNAIQFTTEVFNWADGTGENINVPD